ncbi:uncharacterized, partial [Tachysurus ichikawai]
CLKTTGVAAPVEDVEWSLVFGLCRTHLESLVGLGLLLESVMDLSPGPHNAY